MRPEPVTLTGTRVRLEPLAERHAADLADAARFDEVWTWLDEPTPQTEADMLALIRDAHADQAAGARLPFATIDLSTGRAVGSTSYIDIQPAHRGLEIGWTWLTPSAWGTGINTEAKLLQLTHAFEDLGAIRVAMKTDQRNQRSQAAIAALGATREGVFRNHRILSDGYRRASVYYSVIDTDWPDVHRGLDVRIGRSASRAAKSVPMKGRARPER
jgi:RimJ/RimL family protein N-acetyltransferase